MSSETFLLADPPAAIPGCLTVVVPMSRATDWQELIEAGEPRRYTVRATISDHIPLACEIEDILAYRGNHLVDVNENPLTIYVQLPINHITYYDLSPDDRGRLTYIDVEVITDHPLYTFAPARTALNQLLDVLMRFGWLPLVITRLDLLLKGGTIPIAHQILYPFSRGMQIGPLGGIGQHQQFLAYESLMREAIAATSPYYRFLCACRLYDGVATLRTWINRLVREHAIVTPMPGNPTVDIEMLRNLGLKDEYITGIRNTQDLRNRFNDKRNLVAHFLNFDNPTPLDFSDGVSYRDYALLGAILLFYSHQAFNELAIYFRQNLETVFMRGSILPEIQFRDRFVIRVRRETG